MTTKLSNGIEYSNPNFPKEFGEYLLSNGFGCWSAKSNLCFEKMDKVSLYVRNDNIDLFTYCIGTGSDLHPWHFSQSHAGIGNLNLFGWIMLMHLMGIQSMQGFVKNAGAADPQLATEAAMILREIFNSPLPTVTA